MCNCTKLAPDPECSKGVRLFDAAALSYDTLTDPKTHETNDTDQALLKAFKERRAAYQRHLEGKRA